MKKVQKISVFFIIAVLYYFSVNVLTHSPIISNINNVTDSAGDELFERMYDNVFCNLLKPENTENITTVIISHWRKSLFLNYDHAIEANDHILHSGFIQYTDYSRNFQIRVRKKDLIFPFNYYW